MTMSILKRYKLFLMILLVVLFAGMLLVGCGDGSNGSNGANGDNGDDAEVDTESKVIDIIFAHPYPVMHSHHVGIVEPFADELREKSEGRLNIIIHPGGSLTEAHAIFDDVVSGAIGIGWTTQYSAEGRFPLTEVMQLPFLFESTEEIASILWDLQEQSEALRNEYKDVKVFNLFSADPVNLYTVNTPVHSVNDMAGMRISVTGAIGQDIANALNATPANIFMAEVYDSLERSVIEGCFGATSAVNSFRLHEVVNYATLGMNLNAAPMMMIMNKDLWESLSPEDQELFDSLTGKYISVESGKLYDQAALRGKSALEEAGVEIHYLTEGEKKEFIDRTAQVTEKWIVGLEDRGLPAREVYEQMMEIRETYRGQ